MASNRPTILLVEDEAILLVSLEIELSEAGFEVVTASNGKLALDHIDENTAIVGVVTDIRLGAGPDGWAIARHSRHVTLSIGVG